MGELTRSIAEARHEMIMPTPIVRHVTDVHEEVWSDRRGEISFRTVIGDGVTPAS